MNKKIKKPSELRAILYIILGVIVIVGLPMIFVWIMTNYTPIGCCIIIILLCYLTIRRVEATINNDKDSRFKNNN